MIKQLILAGAAAAVLTVSAIASLKHDGPSASVGKTAPSFTLTDTKGKTVSLADFTGKYVVLEWSNHQCPYVIKHYESGNMQSLQKFAKDKGVIWLTVVSSPPGAAGYVTPEQGLKVSKEQKSLAYDKVLDPDGTVAKEYHATNTPDMYVINPEGVLIYMGAIDDKPSADPDDVKTAHNYVKAALEEALAGKPVTVATSQPYGCHISTRH